MIRIFQPTDKTFITNGEVVLRPFKAKVHKEDNGDYYIDLETSLEFIDWIVEDNIVVADLPQGRQAFRISNVNKTKHKITTRAWHVFYDSECYLIADSNVVNKNCADALSHLNSATEPQSEFTTASDVSTIDSYRCVRTSLYEAINEVLDRWGGHLVRDNFSIQIKSSIGTDNGVTVQYKKNLKEISCEENWNDVVTKLLPVGKDGILLNAVNPSASIYVTSQTQYQVPYTKTVSFDQQNIKQEDYSSENAYKTALVDDLRSQATEYIQKHCVPEVNYTLKANLERITDIGDVVRVIDSRLGVDLLTNVIAFEYDCIAKRYTSIEFGNFRQSLSNLLPTISKTVEKSLLTGSTVLDNTYPVGSIYMSVSNINPAYTIGGVWQTIQSVSPSIYMFQRIS